MTSKDLKSADLGIIPQIFQIMGILNGNNLRIGIKNNKMVLRVSRAGTEARFIISTL